jgi:hypothetical protein
MSNNERNEQYDNRPTTQRQQVVAIPTLPASTAIAQAETAGQSVASQARAMVEARYLIAARFPRDFDVVRERLLKECRRPHFAAVALYSKPVGNTKIIGPSIRFAETAIRCMTNLSVDTMTTYDDREKRIVRVTVADLEANIAYAKDVSIEKTVERKKPKATDVVIRKRLNSYGEEVFLIEAGDDDTNIKESALLSKTIRTLGLRLIPGDLIDECMDLINETNKRADKTDPDAAKRKLFDAFAELGVRVEQLKEYLGHDAETLTPKEMTDLRGVYAAVRDGELSFADVLGKAVEGGAAAVELSAQVAAAVAKRAERTAGAKKNEAPTAGYEADTGDGGGQAEPGEGLVGLPPAGAKPAMPEPEPEAFPDHSKRGKRNYD